MIVAKSKESIMYEQESTICASRVIDPFKYIFKILLLSSDATFLIYLAWASTQLSDLNIPCLESAKIFNTLSLLWTLKILWAICYDKLGFSFSGNYYRLRYAFSLLKYYIHCLNVSIENSIKNKRFKLQTDPSEYPIDTHIYATKSKSHMVILCHLLSILSFQVISITHWIMPFELLKLNENIKYVKFFGVLLVGISIVGQSCAGDSMLFCQIKSFDTDKQMVSLSEALAFKGIFGLLAYFILLSDSLSLFRHIVTAKCLIVIAILASRTDIDLAIQTKYVTNKKFDNFELLVPCLWFFIILHSSIDARWYLQYYGHKEFVWPKLLDVFLTISNQVSKIAATITIGLYLKFCYFSKLFPALIATCLLLKVISIFIVRFIGVMSSCVLSIVFIESTVNAFLLQSLLVCILMICINSPTRIPILLMSLPAVSMHYSMMVRYSTSIWKSVLSGHSTLATIQTISISIYLVAFVVCCNIKFEDITNKVREAHNVYIKKIAKYSSSDEKEDRQFWETE